MAAATAKLDHTSAPTDASPAPSTELFCLCQNPYDSSGSYIGCDGPCNGWFHPQCLGLTPEGAAKIAELSRWICPDCSAADMQPTTVQSNLNDTSKVTFSLSLTHSYRSSSCTKLCSLPENIVDASIMRCAAPLHDLVSTPGSITFVAAAAVLKPVAMQAITTLSAQPAQDGLKKVKSPGGDSTLSLRRCYTLSIAVSLQKALPRRSVMHATPFVASEPSSALSAPSPFTRRYAGCSWFIHPAACGFPPI